MTEPQISVTKEDAIREMHPKVRNEKSLDKSINEVSCTFIPLDSLDKKLTPNSDEHKKMVADYKAEAAAFKFMANILEHNILPETDQEVLNSLKKDKIVDHHGIMLQSRLNAIKEVRSQIAVYKQEMENSLRKLNDIESNLGLSITSDEESIGNAQKRMENFNAMFAKAELALNHSEVILDYAHERGIRSLEILFTKIQPAEAPPPAPAQEEEITQMPSASQLVAEASPAQTANETEGAAQQTIKKKTFKRCMARVQALSSKFKLK